MAQTNIASVLDTPSKSIEKPKPVPVGSYITTCRELPRIDKSKEKQTEFSEYTLFFKSALDDVDVEALEEMGGFKGKSTRATFYHTPDAIWRLKKFLTDMGIPEENDDGEDLTLRERMQMVRNCDVGVKMIHKPSGDGQDMYANVGGTFSATEAE